jgi:hypothetical protein
VERSNEKLAFLEVEGLKKDAIYVFAGYQFKSDYYTKDSLEGAIKEAIKAVENQLQQKYKSIKLRYIGQEIEAFTHVDEEIITKIKNSDICIFELSYENPNVYFELGYSLGITLSKYMREGISIIAIQNKEVEHTEIVSNLLGRFLLKYGEPTDLSTKLIPAISNKTTDLFQDKKFLNRLLWGMYNEKVNIICPHIPKEHQSIWDTRLGERGDFNTVYELSVFLSGILECEVKYYTAKEAESIEDELFSDHVVIVGGPMWNGYTDRFIEEYSLPFKYEWYREEDRKDFLRDEINRRKYGLKEKGEGNKKYIIKDYGMFAKLPSKYNEEKVITLVNGIETFGTLGATRAFTYEPVFVKNCESVLMKTGVPSYFAAMIETEVSYNLFCYPKEILESNIILYDLNTKMWEV